jgi:hypothetical protein
MSITTINWSQIRNRVPDGIGPMIDELEKLCSENANDQSRAIELRLSQRLAELRLDFEQLQAKEKI